MHTCKTYCRVDVSLTFRALVRCSLLLNVPFLLEGNSAELCFLQPSLKFPLELTFQNISGVKPRRISHGKTVVNLTLAIEYEEY